MVTLAELYKNVKAAFRSAGIEDYRFEANCIIGDTFHVNATTIYSVGGQPVPEELLEKVRVLTEKRIEGVPLQYLLGEWEFYGYPFYVGEGVLIPRPDTETLVEEALKLLAPRKTAIDLCSGSGCVAIALDKESEAFVFAVEKYPEAMDYLRRNIALNESAVVAEYGDVFSEISLEYLPQADVITANPPYLTAEDMRTLQTEVSFEPANALFGGEDGLDFYRGIARVWKKKLKPDGTILFEIGAGQEEEVAKILEANGFTEIRKTQDLTGTIRVVSGKISSGGI